MVNGWKVTAIIFICLFIAETSLIYWVYSIGVEDINKEEDCKNICYNGQFDSFTYYEGTCNCWIGNEIKYIEKLK